MVSEEFIGLCSVCKKEVYRNQDWFIVPKIESVVPETFVCSKECAYKHLTSVIPLAVSEINSLEWLISVNLNNLKNTFLGKEVKEGEK